MLLFAAGSIPACIAVALINRHLYGSAFATGYGPFEALYSWSFFWKNLTRYPRWIVQTQTVLVLLAFIAPFLLKADRSGPDRGAASAPTGHRVALVHRAECALVPVLPSMGRVVVCAISDAGVSSDAGVDGSIAVDAGGAARAFRYRRPRFVAAAAIAGVSWHGVSFSVERGAQLQWIAEQRYKTVGAYVDAALPHRAVLICMQHSGSARFYSGRITVRYDVIDPADLALVVSQLRQLGYGPYFVLDDSEEPQFRARFDDHTPFGRLDWAPIATLDHNRVRIYDTAGR